MGIYQPLAIRPKAQDIQKTNRKLYIDDETMIIVTRQLPGQLLFECKIVEDGCEGMGTLDVLNDVVPFFPGDVNIQSFEYQKMPLLLRAYVKDVKSDGSYVFAMRDMITEYEDDVRVNDLFYNSRLTCLLFNQVPGVPRIPAVSSEGFSVSICPAPGMSLNDLKKGMIVEVDNITEGANEYLYGTFLRESPESRFSLADAFHQLMLGYANHEVYNPKEEKDELANAVSMNEVYVSELMAIIDAKATLEEDNIKAYNYLNFADYLPSCWIAKNA